MQNSCYCNGNGNNVVYVGVIVMRKKDYCCFRVVGLDPHSGGSGSSIQQSSQYYSTVVTTTLVGMGTILEQ